MAREAFHQLTDLPALKGLCDGIVSNARREEKAQLRTGVGAVDGARVGGERWLNAGGKSSGRHENELARWWKERKRRDCGGGKTMCRGPVRTRLEIGRAHV